jgi:hypothetical protein
MRGCYHFDMRGSSAVIAVALLLSMAPVAVRQSDQESLANRFYPKWLADESAEDFKAGGPIPYRDFAFADADLDGTGRASYIVAAFSNGVFGAVSVLAKRGTSVVEVAAPRFPLMLGFMPEIRLRDLDHDGRPEVIVGFSSAQGNRAEWVLKWDGRTLSSIADELDEHGDASTNIVNGWYVDLDGDGVLEIVNSDVDDDRSDPSYIPTYDVYSLVKGKYTLTRTLSFVHTFAPSKDGTQGPSTEIRTFAVPDPSIPCEMTILNGDEDGSHEVTSVTIFVNGKLTADTRSFRANRHVVNVRLKNLVARNEIRAVVRGPRQTSVSIFIGPVRAPTP